jgi:hypothetical protein
MLATFAFDVCHDVYCAAREAIDAKIPTLNAEVSGKYLWRPDRLPRLAEYVCDFARAGERALGGTDLSADKAGFSLWGSTNAGRRSNRGARINKAAGGRLPSTNGTQQTEVCSTGAASRLAMFRVYYLGGADYQAARRHLGISELTWADWAEEIRRRVGQELTRARIFPPSKYFREAAEKVS